jgi:hypothetical protein
VPKGKLDRQWNLIVNACASCNAIKSDFEDDISAITLQPDLRGKYAFEEVKSISDARSKGIKSISRRTNKPVALSMETIKLNINAHDSSINLSVELTSPAQVDPLRVYELSRFQLMAFFYFVTYNKEKQTGGYWPGEFFPLISCENNDWGNPLLVSFADMTLDWKPRVAATTAGGFFKLLIKRDPLHECWSWAIEWNLKRRTIGFFGDRARLEQLEKSLPELDWQQLSETIRMRNETPLRDDLPDKLFIISET